MSKKSTILSLSVFLSLPLYRGLSGAEDQVLLDIHFKHPTVVLYRTDVVFGWLDLTGMYTRWGGLVGQMDEAIHASGLASWKMTRYLTLNRAVHIDTNTL
jgi:hypothetical protein